MNVKKKFFQIGFSGRRNNKSLNIIFFYTSLIDIRLHFLRQNKNFFILDCWIINFLFLYKEASLRFKRVRMNQLNQIDIQWKTILSNFAPSPKKSHKETKNDLFFSGWHTQRQNQKVFKSWLWFLKTCVTKDVWRHKKASDVTHKQPQRSEGSKRGEATRHRFLFVKNFLGFLKKLAKAP